ncbi:hypothetical protein ACR8AL_00340 [Clavibacter sepedonicus]|uniref:Uncharacterized protein n=1 Tax=Clavibacter sepedonicus TaxID=31964 RepID=B0RH52_CLASE|nr:MULTISPECIES: hypothetical protein [Clavibacter]MBD5382085.1 hypothetical protein [Clavibacter sp.]OQJ48109.1 hypothetical protein B5P19_07290 [Clavibacter sepedonicus]OQJ54646.1 hypothetical protein B5P20_11490 [Clavibacter sepedonicus]UUK66226.1 hypothetical protein LRE50_03090 [Clavibacter sepedonicus]CAQ02528.1 hypothetical protein CMS2448 [Clavibacter sepedonicus]
MSMRIQIRVYPGNIDRTKAEYLYNVGPKDTPPKVGDRVRFDMSSTAEPEGEVEAVSWSVGFDFLVVDVVTMINERVRQLADDLEWVDIRNGIPDDEEPDFFVG